MKPRHTKAMTVALFVLMLAAVVLAYSFGVVSGLTAAINLDHLDDEPPAS